MHSSGCDERTELFSECIGSLLCMSIPRQAAPMALPNDFIALPTCRVNTQQLQQRITVSDDMPNMKFISNEPSRNIAKFHKVSD